MSSLSRIQILVREIRNAHDGDPWHGPSLSAILNDVDAKLAAARPIASAHTIWEIVLHITSWTREVTHRLKGAPPSEPADGDWPPVLRVNADGWSEALEDLRVAHEDLCLAIEEFPEDRLDSRVGESRDAPLGTGASYEATIHGVAQHDAYHGGQISLLKKASLKKP